MRLGGSATIEMAYIMPVVFLAFTVAVYMGFYLHDKNVLQGIVYEGVIIGGSSYGVEEEELETLVETFIVEKSQERLLYLPVPEVEVNISEQLIQVNVQTERNRMTLEVAKWGGLQVPEQEIREYLIVKDLLEEEE